MVLVIIHDLFVCVFESALYLCREIVTTGYHCSAIGRMHKLPNGCCLTLYKANVSGAVKPKDNEEIRLKLIRSIHCQQLITNSLQHRIGRLQAYLELKRRVAVGYIIYVCVITHTHTQVENDC